MSASVDKTYLIRWRCSNKNVNVRFRTSGCIIARFQTLNKLSFSSYTLLFIVSGRPTTVRFSVKNRRTRTFFGRISVSRHAYGVVNVFSFTRPIIMRKSSTLYPRGYYFFFLFIENCRRKSRVENTVRVRFFRSVKLSEHFRSVMYKRREKNHRRQNPWRFSFRVCNLNTLYIREFFPHRDY